MKRDMILFKCFQSLWNCDTSIKNVIANLYMYITALMNIQIRKLLIFVIEVVLGGMSVVITVVDMVSEALSIPSFLHGGCIRGRISGYHYARRGVSSSFYPASSFYPTRRRRE